MKRTCEPELMNDGEQVAAYAAADFAASDQAVVDRFDQLCCGAPGAQLLDLGCGPGNISFRLAERYPSAKVLGVDGAAAMLRLAGARLAAEPGRWPGVRFVQGLLGPRGLALEPAAAELEPAGRFTALVSNSLLHHLHDPQVLWGALQSLAAPGAAVYIKDLRRPASAEAALSLRARHLAGAPEVLQRDYLASLHAAFTAAEVQQQLETAGLEKALQVGEVDDRYLEVWGRLA